MALLREPPDLFGYGRPYGAARGCVSVIECSKQEADEWFEREHYSGKGVWASSVHLLAILDEAPCGALALGPAMNPASGSRIVKGTEPGQWAELNRMAFGGTPANFGTRVLACTFEYLKHSKPEWKWVQSFADERCGMNGGIYRAASMIYLGEHVGKFIELDGNVYHSSMLNRPERDKRGWSSGKVCAWVKANRNRAKDISFRQFRYVKFLDPRWRKRLAMAPLPYSEATSC